MFYSRDIDSRCELYSNTIAMVLQLIDFDCLLHKLKDERALVDTQY
jgi:hypothetical protein